jgi:hypothetical protein
VTFIFTMTPPLYETPALTAKFFHSGDLRLFRLGYRKIG